MKNFNKGDKVRYVGNAGTWNPPNGAIGAVVKSDEHKVNYIVKFGENDIPITASLGIVPNFWYHVDELEAADEEESDIKMISACMSWSFA